MDKNETGIRSEPAADRLQSENSNRDQGAADEAGKNELPTEVGGRKGLEPTRYGDWEKDGRCIDF